MSHIPTLDGLERDETFVFNGPVSDVLVLPVGESMSHEQIVSFFKPGIVAFMFLIADQTVLSSERDFDL